MKEILEKAIGSLTPERREEALTHVSYANEVSSPVNNERLEFLGDAVLYLAVGHILYERYPGLAEGDLTRMRASLVSGAKLAEIALAGGLGDLIKTRKRRERLRRQEAPQRTGQCPGSRDRSRVLGARVG